MATRIAINGFGRIGRQVLRIAMESFADDIEVVAFNDLGNVDTMVHLLKYDSNYGKFPGTVEVSGSDLVVNGKTVKGLSERNPADLPWGDLGVDIVVESTGIFRNNEKCQPHLDAGAKKVIISAPAKGPDALDSLEGEEAKDMVQDALSRLPERQRQALVLKQYHDMSYQEIAEAMDTSVSSVQMLLHRAMNGLRKDLVKRRDDR